MLRFLVVIVKQALRGFPHIAHEPFLIQNDKPRNLGGMMNVLVPEDLLVKSFVKRVLYSTGIASTLQLSGSV